ncbi:MAG: hypothetical protein WC455_18405 [Dehalococcoidia bacterium]|jgi:hypothetical protein
MAIDTVTTETKTTDQQTPSTDAVERRVPESALRKQAEDFQAKLSAAEAKLKAFEEAQSKAKEEQLKKDGKFQELAAAAEAKAARLEIEFAAKERRLTLEAKLAGITDKHARLGAIVDCPADADVDAYVVKLQAEAAHLFKSAGLPGANPPQAGSSGGPINSCSETNFEEWAASEDPVKRDMATAFAKAYWNTHGKSPRKR